MANYAYLNIWCRNFSTAGMLDLYERVLRLFPASVEKPGLYAFTIRGLSLQESPMLEQDASSPLAPATVIAMAREFLHDDYAYEAAGYWDLWHCSMAQEGINWRTIPTRVEFACQGVNYDAVVFRESGHFSLQLNFEHLYIGHAELLVDTLSQPAAGAEKLEQEFLRLMADAPQREQYRHRTRANAHKLLHYVEELETRLPIERRRLWSEGEADFEEKMRRICST